MLRKTYFPVAVLVALSLVLAACQVAATPAPTSAPAPTTAPEPTHVELRRQQPAGGGTGK
ncbi:MAG: hypothetical protein HY784_04000 [Chloroflexi bacterium]|nr:hypothetical protein [Chloroflexota bacterium]